MVEKDVVVTYETMFELLRIEKSREEIQKLDPNFFDDLIIYINEKRVEAENRPSQASLFETDDAEKARLEFENLKKILKDLYDRREKKIIQMALSKSRTGVNLVNVQNLLPQEKSLFESINSTLQDFRKNILFKIACGETPMGLSQDSLRNLACEPDTDSSQPTTTISPEIEPEPALETKTLKSTPNLEENSQNRQKVRFLAAVEEIIGPDLEIYGPYDEGAVIALPRELARVLIEKQQAEEI